MTGSSTLTNITEYPKHVDQHKSQTPQMSAAVLAPNKKKDEKKTSDKDVSKTIQFLKETHPEDIEHFDIISERMI